MKINHDSSPFVVQKRQKDQLFTATNTVSQALQLCSLHIRLPFWLVEILAILHNILSFSEINSYLGFTVCNTDIPGVVRVLPNRNLNLHTTRSWDFMHLSPSISDGPLSINNPGQNSIIGILDTGNCFT